MLSDRERAALTEVQRQLEAEDPDFVRSFDAVGRPHPQWSPQSLYGTPAWVFTAALVAVAALMVLLQAPATAFGFAAVATGIAVLRHRRNDAGARDG